MIDLSLAFDPSDMTSKTLDAKSHASNASSAASGAASVAAVVSAAASSHATLTSPHIDWTNAAADFLTSGTLGCGNITTTGTVTTGGHIYMPNNKHLYGRNVGDTAYVKLVSITAADHTVLNAATTKSIYFQCGAVLKMTMNSSGQLNAVGGFSDNGSPGVDGSFQDNLENMITVKGGIITDLGLA